MGDVGLPPFVRLLGLEADEGALRALLRLGGDEPPPAEDPPDRGHRGHRVVALGQVEGDGVGPGVQPLVRERLSELNDLVFERLRCPFGAPSGPARTGLQARIALGVEPFDQLVDPLSGDPLVPGHLGLGPPFEQDPSHDQSRQRHRPPPGSEV